MVLGHSDTPLYMPFVYAKQSLDARRRNLGAEVASFIPSDIGYPFTRPFNDSTKVIGFFGEAAKP